jgi:2-desacetyl-2-hydroxyethyl bacteriochlorophyllide A dehydrogenase
MYTNTTIRVQIYSGLFTFVSDQSRSTCMKAIRCERPGLFQQHEVAVPKPGKKEVLIQVKQVGICGTDLHAFAGNQAFFSYPRILGHEIAARVSQSNDSNLEEGSPVVVIPYLHCGKCGACSVGKTNCCERLQVLGVHTDGAMQEFLAIRDSLLIPTPRLSWAEMAMVEPLSVAAHAVNRARIKPGDRILVMGCGPIGLALLVYAKLSGAEVTAMDLNEERLATAAAFFSADHLIHVKKDEPARYPETNAYQVVFDATGNKQAMESGPDFVCHGGTYVLVGLYKADLCFPHPAMHAKELTLLCSRNATKDDFLFVIESLENKRFPVSPYHTHILSFDEVPEKFETLTRPANQVIKAMVDFPKADR